VLLVYLSSTNPAQGLLSQGEILSSYEELAKLDEEIIDWVKDYEKYYYQYKEDRLSVCTLVIHGLLHITNDIHNCRPIWSTWTFWIERFCGMLQRGLHSLSHPWSNLDKHTLHMTYLGQLSARYNLTDELAFLNSVFQADDARHNEKIYPEYPTIYFVYRIAPCKTYPNK